MTSNFEYCFIGASPEVVTEAWKKWRGTIGGDTHFVPAQGGCFLVKLKASAAGPLQWLQTHADEAMNGSEVQQFKTAFETGLIS